MAQETTKGLDEMFTVAGIGYKHKMQIEGANY